MQGTTMFLRIWHSFEVDQLHNVDGKGNDLCPLPNIQVIPPNEQEPRLNYIDRLIKVSTLRPTLFVYRSSGLTKKQIELLEALPEEATKEAERKGEKSKLWVLNCDDYLKDKIATEGKEFQMNETHKYLFKKERIVDDERQFILKHKAEIFKALTQKYPTDLELIKSINAIFYNDFDNLYEEDLKYAEANPPKNIRFPFVIISLSQNTLSIILDINSLYLPRNSKFFEADKNEALANFCEIEGIINPLKEFFSINSIKYPRETVGFVAEGNFANQLLLKQILAPCDLIEFQESKDRTWGKNINILILEEYYKEQKTKTAIFKLTVDNFLTYGETPNFIEVCLTDLNNLKYKAKIFVHLYEELTRDQEEGVKKQLYDSFPSRTLHSLEPSKYIFSIKVENEIMFYLPTQEIEDQIPSSIKFLLEQPMKEWINIIHHDRNRKMYMKQIEFIMPDGKNSIKQIEVESESRANREMYIRAASANKIAPPANLPALPLLDFSASKQQDLSKDSGGGPRTTSLTQNTTSPPLTIEEVTQVEDNTITLNQIT